MPDPRNTFPDNVYHTLSSTNTTNRVKTISFTNNNSNYVIPNPIMYYLLIEKFVLSNKALPIFFFDNSASDYVITVNDVPYTLKMSDDEYRGNQYGESRDSSGKTGGVYFIKQFLAMMNKEFTLAATDISIILRDDGRFEVIDAIAGDEVFFSKKLYGMFPTLEAIYTGTNTREYRIVFEDDTTPGFLHALQESKAQYAWNDIRSILLVSDDLPIQQQGFTTSNNSQQKIRILNEFPPIYSQSSSIDKTDWVFESNQYRPIDLITQEGFNGFTFEVRLISKFGQLIEYRLLPGESATVTFRFVKKALFNNEYNLSNETERIKQNPDYNYHKQ